MKLTVGFTYNLKRERGEIEFDSPEVISLIKKAIEQLGHKVILIEADLNAYDRLKKLKGKVDIVFNIAEGLGGSGREAQIPIFCEMLGIPYTHSRPTVHALGLDKTLTKKVIAGAGVPAPKSLLITTFKAAAQINLGFPLIIKPNREGSSLGVFDKNVVENKSQLYKRLRLMLRQFRPVMVEEYIDGREFTVSLLGDQPEVLPILEQKFAFLPKGFHRIAGYELKWLYEDRLTDQAEAYACPAKLIRRQIQTIKALSVKVFKTLEVNDCARIDWRMGRTGRFYFLEINTLPGLNFSGKEISYFPLSARAAGYDLTRVVDIILTSALRRFNLLK
ncbi:hypothetical protein COX09_00685 [Candidatus Beckwithbacteria bacterium CG23_combo_of_CG06-09_8_20_14_all_47_9]|uniref:ATP-grasp domain-containing protein n=1 Tax=Candidatus Beckwithbacteria bacterium CG23_combo_of_CG06-09_8_20_14_all_47_9 TaxID=1974498 RepID=A0A2H0B4L4_9BACT|nr:MAG: hypothetical protein COX09_00685 [Candidatus Beckwithbacteria bacterium CG23_combo_of_CG06-09_8_20_14_all_47_9]